MLDFGEDEEDRESEISLGLNGEQQGRGPVDDLGESEDEQERFKDKRTSTIQTSSEIRPLPEGWTRQKSRKGEAYYLNLFTNESTWDRPTEAARLAEEEASKDDEPGNSKAVDQPEMATARLAIDGPKSDEENRDTDLKGTSAQQSDLENFALFGLSR